MWLVLAFFGALFTSLTSITAKIGIKDVKSNFATMYRTGIVILCALFMCLITKAFNGLENIKYTHYIYLTISGLCTGLSWICYYKALKLQSINKVAPIDKSSFIISSLLFLIFFFNDTTNNGDILTIVMLFLSMSLMLSGTILMIGKKNEESKKNRVWLLYAVLSAVFAALVSFFNKLGLSGISSNFATLYRTIIVFIFAFIICLFKKEFKGSKSIGFKNYLFLTISGIFTGGAWLCEYAALGSDNSNPVAVNSISKLAILLTMAFSFFILKEKFNKKSIFGLFLLTLGIIVIIIFSL